MIICWWCKKPIEGENLSWHEAQKHVGVCFTRALAKARERRRRVGVEQKEPVKINLEMNFDMNLDDYKEDMDE